MVAPTTAGQVAPPAAVQPAKVTPTALAAVPALLAVNVTLVAASGPLLTTTAVKEAVVPPGTGVAGPDIVTDRSLAVGAGGGGPSSPPPPPQAARQAATIEAHRIFVCISPPP